MALNTVFTELVYDYEALPVIKKAFPNAEIEDASDMIHDSRFELKIEGVLDDDFYPFAIKEGIALLCLGFQIMMRKDKDTQERCKEWARAAGLKF